MRNPKHLLPLSANWSIWRSFCMRSTGFPAALVLGLAAPEAAAEADALLDTEERVLRYRQQAIQQCEAMRARAPEEERKSLRKLLKQLRAGRAPAMEGAQSEVAKAVHQVHLAEQELAARQARLAERLQQASTRSSQALLALAGRDDFREAVLWQNRMAVTTGLDPLLEQAGGKRNTRMKQRERMITRYALRYCLKNDTIGFFGPMAWGAFTDDGEAMELRLEPRQLVKREVFFEHWCIDALAEHLSRDGRLRPFLAPRKLPLYRLEGTTLLSTMGDSVQLEARAARLWSACDGRRSARELADGLVGAGYAHTDEVLAELSRMAEEGWIRWELETPNVDSHPERALREQLERVEDEALRVSALSVLNELEERRADVARAAGNSQALHAALENLEAAFTRHTGQASTRRPGQLYAGRTLVYEDCLRGARVELGPSLRDRLGAPLSLLLRSARWFSHQVAQRYLAAFEQAYVGLCEGFGTPVVELMPFLAQVIHLFPFSTGGGTSSLVQEVKHELQARWSRILGIPAGERRVLRQSASLAPLVADTFDAPTPGWPSARYNSPDLMIAARSPEDVARGDYFFVLGELHSGINPLECPIFHSLHPDKEGFYRSLEADLGPRISPTIPKGRAGREPILPLSRNAMDWVMDQTRSFRPPEQVVPVSELVVTREDKRLVVRTRDGRHRWHVLAFFDTLLAGESANHFKPLPVAPYSPRVSIDDFVICRESWRLPTNQLPLEHDGTDAGAFLAMRRWRRQRDLPRFMFCAFQNEDKQQKPMALDLESPVALDSFANAVQGCSEVVLSEMLPTVEQSWLRDTDGQAYLSELRMAAVDPIPWSAPSSPPAP